MPMRLPKNLYARVLAVKFTPANSSDLHGKQLPKLEQNQPVFQEVGLIGQSELKLINGECQFSTLKF